MAGQAALKFVAKAIQKDPIVVFSKTTCSFSLMAKKILQQVGVSEMTVYEIERRQDGPHIQNALKEMTGIGTVPNVFIKGQSIGGGTDTANLYASGQLKQLLEQHGLLEEKR